MPAASAELKRLRLRTGIKSGAWAGQVQMHRTAYIAVEAGRRPGSAELFARCARRLSELLGQEIDPEDLIASDDQQATGTDEAESEAAADPSTGEAAAAKEGDGLSRGVA
jgi:hypothetical protein